MVGNFSNGEKRTNSNEQFVANNRALLRDFNLSRNRSLRTLETTAESINALYCDAPSDFLITILSSGASPASVSVVVIYRDTDFGVLPTRFRSDLKPSCFRHPWDTRGWDGWVSQRQLKVINNVHSMRGFRLVLCADVSDCNMEWAAKGLKHLVKVGKVTGGLGHFPYKPLIIFERRLPHTRESDRRAGWSGKWEWIPASAL